MHLLVQYLGPPLGEPFCKHLCINYCLDKCKHRCNSSAISSAPFSATSNAPSCASFMKIANIILRCIPWLYCQVDHQLQNKMYLFLHTFVQFLVFLKVKSSIKFLKRNILFNHFLHPCTLASASSYPTQLLPQVHA